MLPVSCAAPSCSSYPQISCHAGTRAFSSFQKVIQDGSTSDGRLFCVHEGFHGQGPSFKLQATKCTMHSLVVEMPESYGSYDSSISSPYRNDFDDIVRGYLKEYFDSEPQNQSYSGEGAYGLYPVSADLSGPEALSGDFGATENKISSSLIAEPSISSNLQLSSGASPSGDELSNLPELLSQTPTMLSSSSSSGSSFAAGTIASSFAEGPLPVSDSLELTNKGFQNPQESIENLLFGINESVNKAEDAVRKAYDQLLFSFSESVESVKNSFDNAIGGLFSSVYYTKDRAGSELPGISSELKETIYAAGSLAIDFLRRSIVIVEDSTKNLVMYVVYSYASAKSSLPPDARNVLDLSEEKFRQIASPVGSAFQQAYNIIEGFERNLGLNPSDPLVPFAVLLGSSATIGVSYWLLKYGGYSGDLSPELTLELLKNEDNVVLIDVRPEALRERDGVPDLRRATRSKYASVTLPEVDGSIRKQLKGGREIDDALTAAVIRNLKVVKDGSKVIVMDNNGTCSKAIARLLKNLGIEKPYLLQGGFQSWVKNGLRVKELKPETALTVFNEEAEDILEDIRPTPALFIGYSLGLSAAIFALIEWEKTLQIIGIIGLGQTLYWRFASYEDSEDLKQDVRLLLSPFKLGVQAYSWAAQKFETNKIGLPTSPSSTAVQDRVLQAAAKHESQPSDSEENQGLLPESAGQVSENLDLSEA